MPPQQAATEKSKQHPGLREALAGAKRSMGLPKSTPEPAAMSRSGCARYRAAETNFQ